MNQHAVPPHDPAAEAAVISSLLLKPDTLDLVVDLVKAADFQDHRNGSIFEAVSAIAVDGGQVDIVTVRAWLVDHERPVKASYLAEVCDATPAVHHIEAHAGRVRDLSRLRKLIDEAHGIAARGYSAAHDVQGYLDQSAATIMQIAESADRSKTYTIHEVITDAFTKIREAQQRGSATVGISSGFAGLDRLTCGWQRRELYVLGARPGMGKTAFMMGTAVNVAAHIAARVDEHGNRVEYYDQAALVFSIEMGRELLGLRMLATEARVDSNRIRSNRVGLDEWPKLTQSSQFLASIPLYIDDQSSPSPIEIRAKARRVATECAKRGQRLSLIAIDYAQLVDGSPMVNSRANREQEVAAVSRAAKRLAKELDVPVLLLAQLNRPDGKGDPGDPQLTNLRESGGLEQDADGVLFIHRPEYYLMDKTPPDKRGVARLILAKQRNGPTGVVLAKFDGRYTLFTDDEEAEAA